MYDMHELRAKNRQELLSLISELKGKLLALRFETATGQLTETHLIKNTKQDIAKIFTVLKEQEKGIVIKEKVLSEKSSKRRFGKKVVSTPIIKEDIPLKEIVEEQQEEVLPIKEVEVQQIKEETSPMNEVEIEKIEKGNS